jgi:hypothetical protein
MLEGNRFKDGHMKITYRCWDNSAARQKLILQRVYRSWVSEDFR